MAEKIQELNCVDRESVEQCPEDWAKKKIKYNGIIDGEKATVYQYVYCESPGDVVRYSKLMEGHLGFSKVENSVVLNWNE